jgi:hypothetical protein
VDEGPAQAADRAHHEQLSHAPIASAGSAEVRAICVRRSRRQIIPSFHMPSPVELLTKYKPSAFARY